MHARRLPLILAAAVVATLAASVEVGPQQVQQPGLQSPVVPSTVRALEASLQGQINGLPLRAGGRFAVSARDGVFDVTMRYEQLPKSFHPFTLPGCIVWAVAASVAREEEGAVNIVRVTAGNYSHLRRLVVSDRQGQTLGEVTMAASVRPIDASRLRASVALSGSYKGPANLNGMSGYDITLRQKGEGKIVGESRSTITTSEGQTYTVRSNTEFVYRRQILLPFDEVVEVEYRSYSFDGRTLKVAGAARVRPRR